jgi:hypothetical protein
VSIYKGKYAVEFIAPFNWQNEKSVARNKGLSYLFHPSDDSLSKKTFITIKVYPDVPFKADRDSLIFSNYEKKQNDLNIFEIQNTFHSSIPAGERMVIKDSFNNIIESVALIIFDNYIIKYCFIPEDLNSYERFSDSYEELISSIRFSELLP